MSAVGRNECGKVKCEGEGRKKNETLLEIGGVAASVELLGKAVIMKQMCNCAKAIAVPYHAPKLVAKCGIEGRT